MKGVAKVIPLRGFIITRGSMPMSQMAGEAVYSDDIAQYVKELEKNEEIKALIFEINSPGGTPYASKEIGEAIKRSKKATVALIKEYGTSGAYWIASTCNKVVADSLSYVGSVGVKAVGVDLSEFLGRMGMKLVDEFTIGKFKDIGSAGLSRKERKLIKEHMERQAKVVYQHFSEEIRSNRKIRDEEVLKNVMSGRPYLGKEAKELGLIDELGDMDKAIEIASELAGEELRIERTEQKMLPKFPISISKGLEQHQGPDIQKQAD
jgi:protease-4